LPCQPKDQITGNPGQQVGSRWWSRQ
jgi:hypothetical protein